MNNRVIIVSDPFDPNPFREVYDVDSHAEFLASRYKTLPPYMALYHGRVSPETNVTPKTKEQVDYFLSLRGDVYAVQYPQEPATIGYIVYAIIFVAVLLMNKAVPEIPNAAQRNTSPSSPNNDLSSRSNKARPNARIPDIYGEQISTPDVLSRTYSTFVDHEEREHSYFCIGRGSFLVEEIKDDTTLISQITNASAEVYGPNTSPNTGGATVTVGSPINERVISVNKTEAVNGQSMVAPNEDVITRSLLLLYPNQIIAPAGQGIDFTERFAVTDEIDVSGTWYSGFIGIGSPYTIYMDPAFPSSGYTVEADGTMHNVYARRHGFVGGTPIDEAISLAGEWVQISMPTQTVGAESINLSGYYNVVSDDLAGNIVLRDVDLFNVTWALLPGGATSGLTFTVFNRINRNGRDVPVTGTYIISAITAESITLTDAGLVNQQWAFAYNSGDYMPPAGTSPRSAVITISLNDVPANWIGPFDVPFEGQTNFIANFVSTGGLYKDDGTVQTAMDVVLQVEYTPISAAGAVLGPARLYTSTIEGSAFTQSRRALTVKAQFDLPASPNARFRARRITLRDTGFSGQVVDDIQWKDLYVTAPVTQDHFGNVTTVQTITVATKGALSLKSRKLNMRVTRILPILEAELSAPYYSFGTPAPTKDFADILAAICLDEKIGARQESELNLPNFRTISDEIRTYFNRESPRRFSYTFDDFNTSFEEMATAVSEACFCVLYRRGNVFNLAFERLRTNSSLLFNHRNKLPKSEKRTINFGIDGNYDGIEYEYVDPVDSAPQTIYLPADGSAVRPRPIKSVGVRSRTQATLQANRIWNKMLYKRTSVEFTATHEAELLLRNDRILVANNVRQHTMDGEVRSLDEGTLILETSQPVDLDVAFDWLIFLQAVDGTVQSVECSQGADEYHVILTSMPTGAYSLNPANYAVTTYVIVPATDNDSGLAFLMQEREYDSPFTSKVMAINYDPRYYSGDQAFSARIAHYMPATTPDYDDADAGERDPGGFYADGTVNPATIPTENDPAYVYGSGHDED